MPREIQTQEHVLSLDAQSALKREVTALKSRMDFLKAQNAESHCSISRAQAEVAMLQEALNRLMMNIELVMSQDAMVQSGRMFMTDESRLVLKIREHLNFAKEQRSLFEQRNVEIEATKKLMLERIHILNRPEYKRVLESESESVVKTEESSPMQSEEYSRAKFIMHLIFCRIGLEAPTPEPIKDEHGLYYFILNERWLVEIHEEAIHVFEWDDNKRSWKITYSSPIPKTQYVSELQFSRGLNSCANHLKRKIQLKL